MGFIENCFRPEIIWLLVGLGLMFLELMLPGLIIIFFGIGALIVGDVCFFAEITLNMQLGIFIVSSLAMLIILRGMLKKVFIGHSSSAEGSGENLSEFVGERAIVKEKITPQRPGKIEFHGSDWTATAEGTIAESEGEKQKRINEAEGRAFEIEKVAEATAGGIRKIALAINDKGGRDAVNLRVAEQYIGEFGKLAKTNNSIIIPTNLADIAGMIKSATTVIQQQAVAE